MRATRVSIDLGALRHNLGVVRAQAPQSRVMAAIKANGYGHGLLETARTLTAAGVDALGVACIDEALQLREAGIDTPLTLLEGFFHADEIPLLLEQRLEPLLHQRWQLEALAAYLPQYDFGGERLPVWLKLDTGMHRLGYPAGWARELQAQVAANPMLELRGFMTHLACADERGSPATAAQLKLFAEVTEEMPGERAIANSAGVLAWPESHADWVRPGIMLYGVSPFAASVGADHGLKPVMGLSSRLIAVNRLKAGEAVGYGATWRAPEAMPVGVVAVGYGDGYPRHAPSGTPVLVNGLEAPLIGRVSMDMITVDLRGQPEASIGAPVELWGPNLPIERVAEAAGTIGYELLCQVTARVHRDIAGG